MYIYIYIYLHIYIYICICNVCICGAPSETTFSNASTLIYIGENACICHVYPFLSRHKNLIILSMIMSMISLNLTQLHSGVFLIKNSSCKHDLTKSNPTSQLQFFLVFQWFFPSQLGFSLGFPIVFRFFPGSRPYLESSNHYLNAFVLRCRDAMASDATGDAAHDALDHLALELASD